MLRDGVAAAALSLALGCSPAVIPRTADLVPPGRIEGNVSAALWSAGRGHVVLAEQGGPRTDGVRTGGMDLPWDWPPAARIPVVPLVVGWDVRWGVASRLELLANGGFERLGAEGRFALLRELDGAPLSVTFSAGGSWEITAEGGLVKAGFDVSRRLGPIAPLLDIYVTYGRRFHTAYLDRYQGPKCLDPLPGTRCNVPLVASRATELRLEGALGVQTAKGRHGPFTFGVVPHVVLGRGATKSVRCIQDCRATTPEATGPTHDFGWHLVVSGRIGR